MEDIHNRYLRFSTLDISILPFYLDNKTNNDIYFVLHRLIQFYNCEMAREKLDISKLEICRMLLCCEYQFAFNDMEKYKDKKYVRPEKICFSSIKAILAAQYTLSAVEMLVLRDIIILQMVLYCNIKSIKEHLQDVLNCDNAFTNNDMKILEYFLESLYLYRFLYNNANDNEEEFKEISSMYLEVMQSLIKMQEDFEWGLFASMFSMLMNTFDAEHMLFPLWDYILKEIKDFKKFLSILSIMADMCFTSSHSIEPIYIHRDIFSNNTFWMLILEGLRSPLQQYRKQASYIMKKAIDSTSKIHISNLEMTKIQVIPFICIACDDSVLPIDSIRQKFFLLYEALEEKQQHLIVPALTHITSLVKANKEHKFCFHIAWLQCILEKILQHENNNIVKWGVSYICELHHEIMFNDQFLQLFINILNNTFLYECQPNEDYPEIVRKLSAFFRYAQKEDADLLKKFLKKFSIVSWGPVAIFYIIHALRISHEKLQHNWRDTELNAIKSLVKKNLNMHSHVLRTASQIELLKVISCYIGKIDNLTLLANVLDTFSSECFTRETLPWNVITTWLNNILTKEDAVSFVEDTCAKYMNKNDGSKISPKTFALMVSLLYDANLILHSTCPAEKALNNWLYSLNDIDVRPYADIHMSIDVTEFISHLLNLSTLVVSNSAIRLTYVHVIFKFFNKNVKRMATKLTYEDYVRYTTIISSYINKANSCIPQKYLNNYVETLQNESIHLLQGIQKCQSMQYLYGLYILHLCQKVLFSPFTRTFYTEYLLNAQEISIYTFNDADAKNLKGKIASEYYLLLSRLMYQYLINSSVHSWVSTSTLLSSLLKFLQFGGTEIVPEIAMILTILVDNKIIGDRNDRESLEHIFKLCWRYTFSNKKNNIFWIAVENLIGVIMNNNFLDFPNTMEFIIEFIDQLIEEGASAPKFKRILLSKMKELDMCNLIKFKKPLLDCLFHGSVLQRDRRVETHSHLFIDKHLREYYPKHILVLDQNNDTAVRVLATILLHRIISHPELDYAASILPLILEILEKHGNKRYFNDSYLHKLKHRSMQILLILEPMLSEELVALLQKILCNSILLESNQHSVRLMQEWLLIRIFEKNIKLHNKLWEFFAESIEKRPGCTISVASIVYHVARLLSNHKQKNFIRTILPYLAQCCLGQHFNMRLYNQFILVQLYELMRETNNGDSILEEYKGIYQAAVASLQQGNSVKNSTRIHDDFYFSGFHPINDYSLQSIFFELPRLTRISCDEWINPNVFKDLMFKQNNNHPLQFHNDSSILSEAKTSMYLTKPLAGDRETLANNVETYLEGFHDIQKKIDPSKPTALLYNDIFETMKESIYQQDVQSFKEGLIVVASFVNRLPNLGGIARTCEIFGVTLVIANLDCIKDKEFQCLSVSAERWINMLQVKPHELQEFLLEKKRLGWSLVGAEQTAHSLNLQEVKFKEKTILILGNEKDGIPANFISLLDMCIEIPQVGVTRSLNVHVTAAICIWQYASQYTLK